MKEINKLTIQQTHADYMKYCEEQLDCEHCKLYDNNINCEVAFGVLSGKGIIKSKFDVSEV